MIHEAINFLSVSARFYFWDGKTGYTVEFSYGIPMWFIFEGKKDSDAVWAKKIIAKKIKSPDRMEAWGILNEYFKTISV